MNQSPEQLALQHHMALCQGHAEALQDALQDMQTRALNVDDYTHLNKADRRLLDQFAYRYTRLHERLQAAGQLMSVLTRFQSMYRALAEK
jgi:ATP-dependent helicase/DNAse subunit B